MLPEIREALRLHRRQTKSQSDGGDGDRLGGIARAALPIDPYDPREYHNARQPNVPSLLQRLGIFILRMR